MIFYKFAFSMTDLHPPKSRLLIRGTIRKSPSKCLILGCFWMSAAIAPLPRGNVWPMKCSSTGGTDLWQ
jgi:hypothetical protein